MTSYNRVNGNCPVDLSCDKNEQLSLSKRKKGDMEIKDSGPGNMSENFSMSTVLSSYQDICSADETFLLR